jgi:CMP-N,N'-diacetyllegionaminic acid synthase
MSINEKKILAVIPARGGSKGILRKNLQKIGDLSLIARAAQIAKSLDFIDAAIVSTEDDEIAQEAIQHGLDFIFVRPKELASDTALGMDVWKHALIKAEEVYNTRFDISILLQPSSPMRQGVDILRTVNAIIHEGYSAAATVSRTPADFSPHKTLTISEKEMLSFYHADGEKFSNRQAIPQYYYRNGLCYSGTREHILNGLVVKEQTKAILIERPIVNIDEPFDLEVARWLLEKNFL